MPKLSSCHGLGPAFARRDGKSVDIREAMGPAYSGLEEAKADVVGMFALKWLVDRGVLPKTRLQEYYASYVAGIFRTVRFGTGEAHGRAEMMEFNYLAAQGAIVGAGGRYRVDYAKMPAAIQQLAKELLEQEATGDRARAEAWFKKYDMVPPALRQSLEAGQAIRDLMEGLLVDGEDRHLRGAKHSGIVERADFQNRRGQTRPTCGHMGAAFGAKFPRHRVLEIAAGKLLRRSLGVAEAVTRHQQKQVGRAAGDILACAAVALRLLHRLALGHIAHLAAIAPAFEFHGVLPALSRLILAGGAALAMLF